MNIIIFGGSGFLGSHTADVLSEAGHEVTVCDIKKSTYLRKDQKMKIADILDVEKVNDTIKGKDIIYNFAATADIEQTRKNPVRTIKNNIIGNTNILESCRINKIKRYVFSSTIYIYNDISSFYGTTKKACELLIENYHREYGVPYTIVRYGSLYGPRAQKWNGVHSLLEQAIQKRKIIFNGTGEEIRELIHVKDAAKLNIELLKKKYENKHLIFTGMEKMRWCELIDIINEMLGNKIDVEYTHKKREGHYEKTPYTFKPETAIKIIANEYHDLGQGLLDCMYEIYGEKKEKY
jgi:UDP-glucose 4-epimerase